MPHRRTVALGRVRVRVEVRVRVRVRVRVGVGARVRVRLSPPKGRDSSVFTPRISSEPVLEAGPPCRVCRATMVGGTTSRASMQKHGLI